MKKQPWGIAASVAGLVLMVLSFLWSSLAPTQVFWSEQDQRVYDDAAERAHQAVHRLERAEQRPSAGNKAAAQAELESANQELVAEQERFASAESRIAWVPRLLLAAGIAALIAGVWLMAR
jgi:hypothetical protein